MAGNVYCFNCCGEPINQFRVNGISAGSISGWTSQGTTLYRPLSLSVARGRNSLYETPIFTDNMPTQLEISWSSNKAKTSIDMTRLAASYGVMLNDDLVLYIAVNQLTLLNARGLVLITQKV